MARKREEEEEEDAERLHALSQGLPPVVGDCESEDELEKVFLRASNQARGSRS